MKCIAGLALMLHLGVAGVYAQQNPVKMNYSGSNVATTINLQDGTVTDEELFAGKGSLGPFTYRELHADVQTPQPSSTCSGPYFPIVTGAGVFRFRDGSLMTVNVTEGAICVDLTTGLGQLTETYQITGGTGRFSSRAPSLAFSFITLLLFSFATQMFAPSKATIAGFIPTLKVPSTAPSVVLSFIRLLLSPLATQMLVPSKATPIGNFPTLKVPKTAPSLAAWSLCC